jgi:hypothetical protein
MMLKRFFQNSNYIARTSRSVRDARADYDGRRQRQSMPRGDDHRPLLQL